jgi:nucleolar pre-ribosomal-associated protein 1
MECQRQMSLSVLFVSVLGSLLVLLSSHYTYQSLGHPIVKTLLLPQWMRRLHSNLAGSHNELILVTLKLLNAISNFAGGRERKSLSEVFSWESKVCQNLFPRSETMLMRFPGSLCKNYSS